MPLKHYNIKRFTEDDQKTYFENSWEQATESNENIFGLLVEGSFYLLRKIMEDRRYEVLGVALHTKMIGGTFKNFFVKFQSFNLPENNERLQKPIKMHQLSEL